MLTALLFATSVLAATCPDGGVTAEQLNTTLDLAVSAFASMDRGGFEEQAAKAEAELPCLVDAVSAAHAAKFHRVNALEAFLARNVDGTVISFQAALRIEPDYALPSSLARPGTPLAQQFEDARRRPPSGTEPVGSALGEATLVDGRKSSERPTTLPVILQWVGEGWEVKETVYLLPGTPLPEWALPRAIDLEAATTLPRKPPSPTPFFVAGGALAATSIVSTILGVAWSNEFNDPATPYDELEGLRDRTNTAAAVSAISGAAAVGFGGAGLYVVIRF